MTQELLAALQPVFLMLIEGVLAMLAPLVLWKFNAWLKSKVRNANFHCAMDKVTTHAEGAVLDISQTYVKGVRKSGKWNGEAASAAKSKALELAKKRFGSNGFKELMACLGQDEDGAMDILGGAIESAVFKFKADDATPSGGHEGETAAHPVSADK